MTKRLQAAALCLALLPSCFTVHIWGLDLEDRDGDGSYSIVSGMDGRGPLEAPDLPAKLLLSPLTIVLDVCTAPIQAYLFGWDSDEEDD